MNLNFTVTILILVFRALITAVVPLALAFAAIIPASGILSFVSQAYALSDIYSEMVLLMGLATGIDYALFEIVRYRDERRTGRSRHVYEPRPSRNRGRGARGHKLRYAVPLVQRCYRSQHRVSP